jgi:hypothetical protein
VAHAKNAEAGLEAANEARRKQQLVKDELDKAVAALDARVRDEQYRKRFTGLRTDLGFLLADAMKLAGGAKAQELRDKVKAKQELYEQEIKKLQQEMKQIK